MEDKSAVIPKGSLGRIRDTIMACLSGSGEPDLDSVRETITGLYAVDKTAYETLVGLFIYRLSFFVHNVVSDTTEKAYEDAVKRNDEVAWAEVRDILKVADNKEELIRKALSDLAEVTGTYFSEGGESKE